MKLGYHGKLIAKRKVAPVPTTQEVYSFERNEAQVFFCHGGHVLKEGPTFTDFYGPMTCVRAAIEEAERLCSFYQVTAESSLIVEVRHLTFFEDRLVLRLDEDGDPVYGNNLNREDISHVYVWNSRQGNIEPQHA